MWPVQYLHSTFSNEWCREDKNRAYFLSFAYCIHKYIPRISFFVPLFMHLYIFRNICTCFITELSKIIFSVVFHFWFLSARQLTRALLVLARNLPVNEIKSIWKCIASIIRKNPNSEWNAVTWKKKFELQNHVHFVQYKPKIYYPNPNIFLCLFKTSEKISFCLKNGWLIRLWCGNVVPIGTIRHHIATLHCQFTIF